MNYLREEGDGTMRFLLFALFILSINKLFAGEGLTAFQFLKIPPGARPVAMGGSFTGLCDDINAIWYNPAGLTQIENIELFFTHIIWFENIYLDFLMAAKRIKKIGTLAATLTYFDTGNIPGYDKDGNPTGDFKSTDMGFVVSYGRKLSKSLSLGTNLKILQEKIENESTPTTPAFDLACMYKLNDNLKLGAILQNIGPGAKFKEVQDPLPAALRVGGSFKFKNLLLASDINLGVYSKTIFSIGGEYSLQNISDVLDKVSFRCGYKTENTEWLGPLAGLSAGVGIKQKWISGDYAIVPYGDLGLTHRISLTAKF